MHGAASRPDRLLVCYARPQAFVEKTTAILARLGYRIMAAEDLQAMSDESIDPARADLLIADESRLVDATASSGEGGPPIVLLTGRSGARARPPRVVAAIRRPVGLHDLYRVVQQILEEHPRSLPRVATKLPARCGEGDDSWTGSLLSLSENGGLLRCDVQPPLGACFQLSFDLPGAGPVELRAEAAYQLLPDLGVVFSGIDPAARAAIGHFVGESLLA